MQSEKEFEEFQPELIPRRGEIVSWGLALVVTVTWIIVAVSGKPVITPLPLLALFLVFSGVAISMGNWMDRRTRIITGMHEIAFENGLRHVRLRWEEIQQVKVFPSNWGKRVSVIGSECHFEYRTLGKVQVSGEVKGQVGFLAGDIILERILTAGNLGTVKQEGTGKVYSRG